MLRDGQAVSQDFEVIPVGETIDLDIQASDPELDSLTLANPTAPSGSSFLGIGNTGQFTWTPGRDQRGDKVVRFTATDGIAAPSLKDATLFSVMIPQPAGGSNGRLVTVGITDANPPRAFAEVWSPTDASLIRTVPLLNDPDYVDLWNNHYAIVNCDEDTDDELAVMTTVYSTTPASTWVEIFDLVSGQKIKPTVRVMPDPDLRAPRFNQMFAGDMDGNGTDELVILGMGYVGTGAPRYYLHTFDPQTMTQLHTLRAFFEPEYDNSPPSYMHFLTGNVTNDAAEEMLCIGTTSEIIPRYYCERRNGLNHYAMFTFRVLPYFDFDRPQWNRYVLGDMTGDGIKELLALGVTGTTPPRTWLEIYDCRDGGLVRGAMRVLNDTAFDRPDLNTYLTGKIDNSGMDRLIAIGVTNENPARFFAYVYDETGAVLKVFRVLPYSLFHHPETTRFMLTDTDNDGINELVAMGNTTDVPTRTYMEVWKPATAEYVGVFRVLPYDEFSRPALNVFSAGKF